MKILYVEDDPLDADLTRRELAKTAPQLELDIVTTVHEARERLEGEADRYDLALIDLKLPNGDGMELLRTIRERSLPLAVVIITGRGDEDTAVAALKAGADDYVVKRQNYLKNLPLTLKDVLKRSEARASRRSRPMRVLYAEHSTTDIALTERHLARHARHIELQVVQTGEEVLQRLSDNPEGWDVLLLDYNLPGTNVLEVLKEIRQRRGLDIPIVLVTGRGSEDIATQVLKLGAADYLVKNPGYLFQLPSVLENVFHRAQLARERAALQESEAELNAIIENSPFIIMTVDRKRRVQKINHTGSEFAGHSTEEILGLRAGEALRCTHALDDPRGCGFGQVCQNCIVRKTVEDTLETGKSYHGAVADITFLRKGREERRTLLLYTTPLTISGERQAMVVFQDVTERKRSERLLRALNSAALATEQAFTPEEVFKAVAEEFKRVGFSCALYLTDKEQTKLFPKYLTYKSAAIRTAERLVGVKHEGFSIPVERADAYREVVQEKKTVFVEDTAELVRQLLPRPIKRFAPQIMRIVGIQKAIDAPLVVEGEVIGILAVQSDDLTAADIPTITAFAHQMAAVWHKAQLFEQAQDLTKKLKAIARPARQMSALMDKDELASQVVQSLQEITGCYNANLFLREGDDMVFVAGQGGYKDKKPPTNYRLPLGEGIIGHVARNGQPALVPDVSQDPHYKAWGGLPSTRSEMSVPIKRGDHVLGVMDMQSEKRDAFDAADLEALGVLADQLAVALENARLFEETQRLKQFNEDIVQSMTEGIVIEDTEGNITFVNPMAAELLGYDPNELLGQHWRFIIAADQRAKVAQESAKRPRGVASRYETALLRKDGYEIPVIVSARPLFDDGRFSGVLSVFTDITERKKVEETLQEHTQRLEILHEIDKAILEAQSPEKTAQAALRHLRKLVHCNAGATVTFDLEAQEAVLFALHTSGRLALQAGTHLPLKGLTAEIESLRQGQVFVQDDVTAISQPPPAIRVLQKASVRSCIVAPLMARGDLIGALALWSETPAAFTAEHVNIVSEVTDQVAVALHQARLSAALETERRRLETTMEHAPEGILLLDDKHRILLANPTAQDHLSVLTDTPQSEVLTHLADLPLEDLLAPPLEGPWHELEILGPPHRVFEVLARPVARNTHHPEGWVLTLHDVTEERKVQERIQRQERLAAVGQLAGGVAHDFRNFLAPIVLYAHMALRNSELPPELAPAMETIINESHQASELVQQILDFSRRSMMKTQPLDLKPFVREAVRMLKNTIPESISVLLEVEEGEYVVKADPTRIQQVLINLALNARDAMMPKSGGELQITLSGVTKSPKGEHLGLDEVTRAMPDIPAGEWVCLAVSDTGVGMTDKVQSHLFEPFFSTKEPGKGVGLGLAQVHGIVDQHEGYIGVETEVGVGTTFSIYLPAYDVEKMEEVKEEIDHIPPGKGETILLVEDEDSVRQAVKEFLTSLGYRLMAAKNGKEALEMCQAVRPDLVITDLVMPEMGGQDLIQALREENPDLKSLIITGYGIEGTLEKLEEKGILGVIEKPLETHHLAQAVRQALDEYA